MAAKWDSGMSYRTPMWHRLENLIQVRPGSVEDVMKESATNWPVLQRPVLDIPMRGTKEWDGIDDGGDIKEIDGYLLNYRGDTGAHLGIVSKRYTVIQNETMFQFAEDLVRSPDEEVLWETAGSLDGGRVVWALLELPQKRFTLPGTEDWNTVYIMVCNGHYTGFSFKAAVTGVRVQCWNTLQMALGENASSWTVNHTGDPTSRIREAQHTLGLAVSWHGAFSELAAEMANTRFGVEDTQEFLEELYPIQKEDMKGTKTRIEKKRGTVFGLVRRAGVKCSPIAWTKWSAMQGVTEFVDYKRPASGSGSEKHHRMLWRSMVEPDNADKGRALALLS